MSKVADAILEGLKDAAAYAKGDTSRARVTVVPIRYPVDVRAIRERAGLSEDEFTRMFGFNPIDVEDWECGKSMPSLSARMLLTLLDEAPETVRRILGQPQTPSS